MSSLAIYLLGPPRIERGDEPVHISRRKAVALLAYLAVTGTPHSRDALATLLWPERSQSRARAYLRRALSELNRTLGEGILAIDRETAGLSHSATVSLDVDEFRARLQTVHAHDHPQTVLCPDCRAGPEEAVELYSDDFMAGFTLRDCPAFDEWQFFQREALRGELAGALERLAAWHGAQGEHERAIAHDRRWLELYPLAEAAHRHLIALYAASGQRNAALRQYAECERLLQEELGVPPEEETRALAQTLSLFFAPFKLNRERDIYRVTKQGLLKVDG
jgi:DNA-binding SARP family transcriptional activator